MNYFRSLIVFFSLCNVLTIHSQTVKYAPAWFGPNANPVADFGDARIPAETTVSLMGDYYFGFGDKTSNVRYQIEIPLLPSRVSLSVWNTGFERFSVTDEVKTARGMTQNSGKAAGDFYVQTRISLWKETDRMPDIILNATIKSASGTNFIQRRYFDTPGYYFDVAAGKSFDTGGKFISEIRAVANLGFLCWETSGSLQDDAPMYGGKIILGNKKWQLDNSLSGYWGWIHTNANINPAGDYGDAPLVYASKFTLKGSKLDYFTQYQYGIKDFPYQQIRVGISFPIIPLTPKGEFLSTSNH
ncbi:MAG: hypothetical protein KA177_02805 [Paludibacter sp.]|nr:hypothetical protein [Paludibacter sp.]